jgi:long-chain fatty acid transport protein
MKKRTLTLAVLAIAATAAVNAGGLMTNTNYHIAFDRMFARGATTEIDGAFSNPAGLAWGHEGLQLSLNFQKPWQNRDIEAEVPNYLAVSTLGYQGVNIDQKYNGKASAPIVPALFASYKKNDWALSAMIGIVGSGGFVKYDDGIPMFNLMTMGKIFEKSVAQPTGPLTPDKYQIDSNVKGKQYIYGAQLNFAYKPVDCLSVAVGLRANYYDGYNRGYVTATTLPQLGSQQLMDLQLDVTQRAWGFAPLVSACYHNGPLTISARYEFRAKINTKNDTKALSVTMMGQKTDIAAMAAQMGNTATLAGLQAAMGDEMAAKIKNFMPDEYVRYDMPALFVAAVGYEFTPKLRAALEYHFFDDTHAKMADDRQKELKHGTHEVLAGVEYDLTEKITVSCGGQRTDYGLSDTYQQNTSFACDSYSVGLGGAIKLTDKMRLNVSYFCSLYSDYKCDYTARQVDGKMVGGYLNTAYSGSDTYSRTNHVIGVGVDYRF